MEPLEAAAREVGPQALIAAHSREFASKRAHHQAPHSERKSVGEALELCPILKPDELTGAVLSRSPADIEVPWH